MRRALAAIGLVLLLAAPGASQQTGLTEGQIKSAELEVPELVKLFELKPGMTIADVGAGFGAWTVQFSKVVGPSGRVYSTDVGDLREGDVVIRRGNDEIRPGTKISPSKS
jgi:predicted methyltransferase